MLRTNKRGKGHLFVLNFQAIASSKYNFVHRKHHCLCAVEHPMQTAVLSIHQANNHCCGLMVSQAL